MPGIALQATPSSVPASLADTSFVLLEASTARFALTDGAGAWNNNNGQDYVIGLCILGGPLISRKAGRVPGGRQHADLARAGAL